MKLILSKLIKVKGNKSFNKGLKKHMMKRPWRGNLFNSLGNSTLNS